MTIELADYLEQQQANDVAVKRLDRDLAEAGKTLTTDEARYLVWQYYQHQKLRIAGGHQIRTLNKDEKPHDSIDFIAQQIGTVERQIVRPLDKWTDAQPLGVWAKSICGIGPVIAAGLLAHIDIEQCPTAGHIWAFAGLDPTKKWEKKTKRPYNAELKTLCAFKMGESFVKVQNNKSDVYGKVFAARKAIEIEKNEQLLFAELAQLRATSVRKETEAYKYYSIDKLPPAHIHARARRYAVKLFLSHYHCVAYFLHYGVMPPFPYVFSHLPNHVHFIAPPNADQVPGLVEAVQEYEAQLRKRGPILASVKKSTPPPVKKAKAPPVKKPKAVLAKKPKLSLADKLKALAKKKKLKSTRNGKSAESNE